MAAQFRRMLPGDVDRVAQLTASTFVPEHEREFTTEFLKHAYRDGRLVRPELGFVATALGEIVGHVQLIDLTLRVGRARLRAAGMFGALAEPNARHSGLPELARHVLLEEAAQLGFDVCVGFAKRGGIYARGGAIPVALDSHVSIDALYVPPPRARALRPMQGADEALVLDMHARGNAERVGSIVRTAAMWPLMPRRSAVFLVGDEGYVGLRVRRSSVEVREIAGFTPRFFDAAIRELAALARERGKRHVTGPVPVDHPLVEAARPYGGELTASAPRNAGCMAKVLAPARTLERLAPELEERWAAAGRAATALDLRLASAGSDARLVLGDARERPRRVDVEVPEQHLTSMVFGYRSAPSLFAARDDAPPPATLDALSALFPPRHAFIWDADRW